MSNVESAAKKAFSHVLSHASPKSAKSVDAELNVLAKGELAAEKAVRKVISPLSFKNLLALALLYPHLSSSPEPQRKSEQRVEELNEKWKQKFGDEKSLSLYEKHSHDDSMMAFEKLHKDKNFAWVSYTDFLNDWEKIKQAKYGKEYKNLASAFFTPKSPKVTKRKKEKLLPRYL